MGVLKNTINDFLSKNKFKFYAEMEHGWFLVKLEKTK